MENNKVKFNLYRLKSLIIQNKYNNNLVRNDNFLNIMNKNIKNLKQINLIYTRADIESLKNGSTSYPDTLLYNEILHRYNFFGLILGFIDGNILYINKKRNKEDYKNLLTFLIDFRNQVIIDFKDSISICEKKELTDLVLNNPCYENFIEAFTNSDDDYDLIKINFISNYSLGYSNFNKTTINKVFNDYNNLIEELDCYKKRNLTKVQKVRRINKKR